MKKTLKIAITEIGQRLDIFCVRHIPGLSRAVLQRAIKEGNITVNDKTVKPRYTVRDGDVVNADLHTDTPSPSLEPVELPSPPILYQDEDIVVIDKPAGIVVHPGVGNATGTIADWFTDKYPQNSGGLVHRLDKDTSGVLLLAKTTKAYDYLKTRFKKHRVKKEYLALVFGVPRKEEGRINQPLARSRRNPLRRTIDEEGKPAITEWRLEQKLNDKFSLLRVFPLTGRTHQIRVHLHFIGFPIVGDPLYVFKRQHLPAELAGLPSGVTGQLLHAEKLTLTMPSGKRKTFSAPLPDNFQSIIKNLTNMSQ